MVVLDAQRYGLAQLHQLRGRVGRGAAKSYCILVYPDDAGESERLEILTRYDRRLRDRRRRPAPARSRAVRRHGSVGRRAICGSATSFATSTSTARRSARPRRSWRDDPQLERPEHAGLRAALETQPSTRALLLSS